MWLQLCAQSPHGDGLTISCDDCHNPNGWTMVKGSYTFTHNSTNFALKGQHEELKCQQCHPTLVFSEANSNCMSCHTDMHEQTVGFECERCHNEQSWIVNNIVDIHRHSRFPLLGAHLTASCNECHPSASLLNFEPRGVNCYDCHSADYQATESPNHIESGFSTSCHDCHKMNAFSWQGTDFTHAFFPLTEGHANQSCNACHVKNDYSNISSDCISCHQSDYNQTDNPSHQSLQFSNVCTQCHTTAPGWKPAEYKEHDTQSFPIYSGKHSGEWDNCIQCHPNPGNYAQFTCIECHEHDQGEMDDKHKGIGGYVYESVACLECHPTGDGEGGFNHNASEFPLTGAHLLTVCADCHEDGYAGTPTYCADCHLPDFNQSVNPNHLELGLQDDCAKCHTTAPEWKPAVFDIHNDYYTLSGGHIDVANDCISCHNGDYINTPNACNECHTKDYNETSDPNHVVLDLSIVCEDCHTTNPGWEPAQFEVHNDYYPLTGAHAVISTDCKECHETGYENTPNTCSECHTANYDQSTNPNHTELNFPTTCEDCHTTNPGWEPATFDIHDNYYALTGAHVDPSIDCLSCHETGYDNTPNTCFECHESNYNQSTNPNHSELNFATTCEDCHTTSPGWEPALFEIHDDYYPLTGAHADVSTDCLACHESGYDNTPNTCSECHTTDYNQSTNPSHTQLNLPTTCEDCHTTNPGWEPALFEEHNNYYPLLGAHAAIATDCNACHGGNYENTPNTCYGCHQQDYEQSTDPPHATAQFPTDCEECHSQSAWVPSTFDHDAQYFPIYTGKHAGEWASCIECHTNPGNFAVFSCIDCHEHNKNDMDDKHQEVNDYQYNSIACLDCHPDGNAEDKMRKLNRLNIIRGD